MTMPMATSDMARWKKFRRIPAPAAWTVLAVAIAHAPAALAAEWRVTPRLELRETYSDNIGLAPAGSEQSDFVTEVAPGIGVTATGPRLKLRANYLMRNLFYARETSGRTTQHQLDAA